MGATGERQAKHLARWRAIVSTAARLLCECDGRCWDTLAPWEQDRYARIAALIEDTIDRMRDAPGSTEAMN